MKLYTFLLFLISFSLFSQEDKYWYAFTVEDTIANPLSSSLGFKDSKGNVKIKPIYSSLFTQNNKFEKIVAVTEYSENNSKSYYLNKKGKKFGIDSLYTFDFSHDTEQEGFIRFSVGRYLDSIGLFNANGKVVIEPKYNSLSKVTNGLLIAKIGAKQKHENHHAGCDHWSFEGGKEMLIDTLGNVLLDNFKDNDLFLNLYSLKITDHKSKEKFRHNFKGKNNKYYSFISYKEEFENFINNDFLKNISNKTSENYLFITIQEATDKTKSNEQRNEILNKITILKKNKITFSNFPFFYFDLENQKLLTSMEKYVNNANELNSNKHPTFEIQSVDKPKNEEVSFSFIRTENGYKIYDFRIQK